MAEPDTMYVAYGYKGWPGYGYVFPKRDCVDAGVGFLLPFFKRELGGPPYAHHARFLEEVAARGIVRGRSNPDNFKAYRLPLGGPLERTYAERMLVCGDAGGFVNAYTGEGIYYAMVTGRHAGEVAADVVASGDGSAARLADYEARWRAEIGDELADSVRIQRRLFGQSRAGRRDHPGRRARPAALPAVRAGGARRGQPAPPPAGDGLALLRGEAPIALAPREVLDSLANSGDAGGRAAGRVAPPRCMARLSPLLVRSGASKPPAVNARATHCWGWRLAASPTPTEQRRQATMRAAARRPAPAWPPDRARTRRRSRSARAPWPP